MPKYFNKRCTYDQRSFASQGERDCYAYLKLLEKAGEINLLACQEVVYLTKAEISYRTDFTIKDLKTDEVIWIEYKRGLIDARWLTNKKLWKYYGPGKLRVMVGTGLRMKIDETIIPEL